MQKIPAMALVRECQRMWAENWKYVWGGASVDKIDCSGVLVYVYKQHGLKIYHGSNRIARVHVERLIPIEEAIAGGLIVPGMAAFRSRGPGEAKYELAAKYKPGGEHYNGDIRAYYHIGVVDEDTAYVLNAAGTRDDFERDLLREGWSHVAKLTDVDYDTQEQEETAVRDIHNTIRKGAKGPSVVELQGLLTRHGFQVEADGKFGAKTEEAVKAFQRAHALDDDGIVGPQTWLAMDMGMTDEEMVPEPPPKTWAEMSLEERVEDLHKWRLSMMGGVAVGQSS